MERIFLSMSFQPEDQALVAAASAIIESQDLRVMTGKNLAGAGLSAEIKRRIDDCDALVAICSRRDPVPGGNFTVSSWVRDELLYALAKQKPLLALVEDGVDLGGMMSDHERAPFSRGDALGAFAKLALSVAQWRQTAGLVLRAAIAPVEVAVALTRRQVEQVEFCSIRNGTSTPWTSAPLVKEVGGLYAYLKGVPRDGLVKIRTKVGKTRYESIAVAPHYYFTLETNTHG
jgi:hypothetical protein